MSDLQDDESRLVEALSALDVLFQQDLEACFNIAEARQAVERANLEDKRQVLCEHLKKWADCLSGIVGKVMLQQAELLAAYSAPNPIDRADERMRDLLDPKIGHKLGPKISPENFGKWLPLDPEYIDEWLTGGEKPSSSLVWWVAEVAAGEGEDLTTDFGLKNFDR